MTQLRWTLLLLGALFLVGLALWESLRGRRARQADLEHPAGAEPAPRERELRARERERKPLDAVLPSFSARDPERARADAPLPVYALPPSEAPEPGRRLDPILDFGDDTLAAEESGPVITEPALEQAPMASPVHAAAPAVALPVADIAAAGAAGRVETGTVILAARAAAGDDFEIGPVRVIDPPVIAADIEPMAGATVGAVPADLDVPPVVLPRVTEPIVEWPDPEHSRVLSVRILAPQEKFQGRAVRLALTAQGFLPGRFSIYHLPAQDGRALLSVASLTKPGTFDDPPRGDMQRFSGLNLFTVLPGPLPPADAVEELLRVAGVLSARLQARLTDDRGEPLSASRAQELRAMASAQVS